jgi:hypothetical protein
LALQFNFAAFFLNKNLLDWMVGEIHVIDPRVKPNTERVAFEPSSARDDLEKWIKDVWVKEVKDIPRKISAEISAKKRLEQSEQLMNRPVEVLDSDEKWMIYLSELRDVTADLERDSKDQHVPNSLRSKDKDRKRKLSYHQKRMQESYDNWKRSQLKLPRPLVGGADSHEVEVGSTVSFVEVASESETGQRVSLEGPDTIFLSRPNEDLLERVEPLVQGLIDRAELTRPQADVVTAGIAALSTMRGATYDFLRDFLIKWEEALKQE